jgi:hypothetical protein
MELDLVAMAKAGGITLSDEVSSAKYVVISKTLDISTRRYEYEKKSDTEIVFTTITDGQSSSAFVLTKQ